HPLSQVVLTSSKRNVHLEVNDETTNSISYHPHLSSAAGSGVRAGSIAAHGRLALHLSHAVSWTCAVAVGRQRLPRARTVADKERLRRHRSLRREYRHAHRKSLR